MRMRKEFAQSFPQSLSKKPASHMGTRVCNFLNTISAPDQEGLD